MLIAMKILLDARWYLAGEFFLDDTVEIKHIWRDDDGEQVKRRFKLIESGPARERIVQEVILTIGSETKTYKVRNPRHIFDYERPPHPVYGV